MEKQNVTDEVLVKYLLGEASLQEIAEVEVWMASDPANKKHYDDFKRIWDESRNLEATMNPDTEAAWTRFSHRIANDELRQKETRTKQVAFPAYKWSRIAAAVVVLISGAWMVYKWNGNQNNYETIASLEQVLVDTLPDGSVITLNKHAELTYPKHFASNERRVILKGEAFFNVAPNKQKPFIITAGNSSVKVVGTSFNVKTSDSITEVIVETGIVEVAKLKKAIKLLPGEKATVTAGNDSPVEEKVTDELYNYYRTNEFVCNGTPLGKLVATLNEAYGVHIVLGNSKIEHLLYSNTFRNETLDNILRVICSTFNLRMERRGTSIILNEN